MEEIASLIFKGCNLANDLEQTLPNMTREPHVLISSCDEISKVFADVRDRLRMAVQEYGHHDQPPPAMEAGGSGSVSEWLRSSHAMNMVVHEQLAQHQQQRFDQAIVGQELGGGNVEVMELDAAHSLLQRTRRRYREIII